jgi:hypothetical protein
VSRWKAAAIHSIISAITAVLVGTLLFGVWYPPPYFRGAGADELMLLLLGVDLAIGPLLTLLVFRAGKWGLRFDLATIGILQAVALIYGMSIILRSRPVFLVAEPDRFVLVSANEIDDSDLAKGREPTFRSRSWTGPRLVAAELPSDMEERNALVFSALGSGHDIENQPKYYHNYAEARTSLLKNAKPLAELARLSPSYEPMIIEAVNTLHRVRDDVVWLPLRTRKADEVMLLDAKNAQPLRVLAGDPWPGQ